MARARARCASRVNIRRAWGRLIQTYARCVLPMHYQAPAAQRSATARATWATRAQTAVLAAPVVQGHSKTSTDQEPAPYVVEARFPPKLQLCLTPRAARARSTRILPTAATTCPIARAIWAIQALVGTSALLVRAVGTRISTAPAHASCARWESIVPKRARHRRRRAAPAPPMPPRDPGAATSPTVPATWGTRGPTARRAWRAWRGHTRM